MTKQTVSCVNIKRLKLYGVAYYLLIMGLLFNIPNIMGLYILPKEGVSFKLSIAFLVSYGITALITIIILSKKEKVKDKTLIIIGALNLFILSSNFIISSVMRFKANNPLIVSIAPLITLFIIVIGGYFAVSKAGTQKKPKKLKSK